MVNPEMTLRTGMIFSGITYCVSTRVANPSRKTLMVCVKVTVPPRMNA